MVRRAAISLSIALVAGCSAEPPRLFVDLVTDYTADRHFSAVRTEVWEESAGTDGRAFRAVDRYVQDGDDYLAGVRVAEIEAPPSGPALLRVTLLADDERPIGARTALLHADGDFGVTVLITRDCAPVSCAEGEACQGGDCIASDCLPEAPESCEPPAMSPECEHDADCVTDVACAHPACVAGLCLVTADDALCADGEVCDEHTGCVPDPFCGDARCDAGESYCDCPTDCADGCGSACCTGEDRMLPDEIPDEPPPPDPPPGVPPGPGECVVVCCDGFTETTTQPDAYACRDYYRNCRPHGRVETMHFEGFQIYERPPTRECVYCCALCKHRLRYHRVLDVVLGCGVAARDFCDEGTRGGFEDADWRDCAL